VARPGADRSVRSARRGRRTLTVGSDGDRAVDGATVVQAVVHARLLGLRLLTLDARVVVAPAELEPTSLDLVTSAAVDSGTGRPPPPSVDGGVSRARELLAEGTHTLARAAAPA
jgi:hypothetical protein